MTRNTKQLRDEAELHKWRLGYCYNRISWDWTWAIIKSVRALFHHRAVIRCNDAWGSWEIKGIYKSETRHFCIVPYLALWRRILAQNQQAGEQIRVSPHVLSWVSKFRNPKRVTAFCPGKSSVYFNSISVTRREDHTVSVRLSVCVDVSFFLFCVWVCVCVCERERERVCVCAVWCVPFGAPCLHRALSPQPPTSSVIRCPPAWEGFTHRHTVTSVCSSCAGRL